MRNMYYVFDGSDLEKNYPKDRFETNSFILYLFSNVALNADANITLMVPY